MTYSGYAMKKFEDQLNAIKDAYEYQCARADMAFERMQEWSKDKEIEKLKADNNYIIKHSLLQLSDKELETKKAFIEEHYERCAAPLKRKDKGNTWIYELTGTGIGTIIKIICPLCGESLDITDLNNW